MHERIAHREFAQVVLKILLWRFRHGHLAQELRIHQSCTSVPTGSCKGDLGTNILHKKSEHGHRAQEVLSGPDARILTPRSCASGPKRSAYRDVAQVVLQRPDVAGPLANSVGGWPAKEVSIALEFRGVAI